MHSEITHAAGEGPVVEIVGLFNVEIELAQGCGDGAGGGLRVGEGRGGLVAPDTDDERNTLVAVRRAGGAGQAKHHQHQCYEDSNNSHQPEVPTVASHPAQPGPPTWANMAAGGYQPRLYRQSMAL